MLIEDSMGEFVFIGLCGEESLSTVSAVKEAPTESILFGGRAFVPCVQDVLERARGDERHPDCDETPILGHAESSEPSRVFGSDSCEAFGNRYLARRVGGRTTRAAPFGRGLKQWESDDGVS